MAEQFNPLSGDRLEEVKRKPFISVIVAVFNGKQTLEKCIDSFARQIYPHKEMIIIDGGSQDGTVDVLRNNQDILSYWISEPDRGIYNAWNKGLAQAKGEWFCFLGADDYFWDDAVLERMAANLVMLPDNIRVAYGVIMLIGKNGEAPRAKGEPWEQNKEFFKEYMCIPHVGTMHRRSLFEQRGNFDETFRIAGDYELLLRELSDGDAAFFPDIITAGQLLGGISTHRENYLRTLLETWRAQRMHGRYKPGKYLRQEMIREFLQLMLWKILGDRLARKLLDLRRRTKGLPPHWTQR